MSRSSAEEYGLRPARKKPGERQAPSSPESERGILGCIFLNPSNCLDACQEANVAPEWFHDLRNGTIYQHMLALRDAGPTWDVITLQQKLKDAGLLEQVGGLAYLARLPDEVPSAAHVPAYIDVVREKWQLREVIAAFTEGLDSAYNAGDAEALLAETHRRLLKAAEAATRESEHTIKTILHTKVVSKLEAHYHRGKAQITGITTGLEYLDKIYCGLSGDNGPYNVIAARPNVGKTSLVTQIAQHVALDYAHWDPIEASPEEIETLRAGGAVITRTEDGKTLKKTVGLSVGISSLEMREDALVQKMLFQRGGADLQRWRTGYARDSDLVLLFKAIEEHGLANRIVIDDTPRLRIGQLKARWRRWYRQYGVRLFILDYLQLMQADSKRFRNDRVQELAEVSAELQALGKELNCPMLILAQMNRDYEKDPGRAPRMSDLKDCGAVEQDADTVTFLYEPRLSDTQKEFYESAMQQFYESEMRKAHGVDWETKAPDKWRKWDGRPQRINALIAKNRLGPKGKAELLLLHASTKFVDWNVWLKQNRFKAAAAGESQYKQQQQEEPDDGQ